MSSLDNEKCPHCGSTGSLWICGTVGAVNCINCQQYVRRLTKEEWQETKKAKIKCGSITLAGPGRRPRMKELKSDWFQQLSKKYCRGPRYWLWYIGMWISEKWVANKTKD